ncbi:hypothetical protein HanRHA438_Chr14g0677191 [Helianthus annuus]|uniref:Uncharacterized protein n=1 Tax=Helianthus annuus TaxID=4232 RepID=A0A9K3H9M5_HELAN|nr:hypothetical protein HanXRQr2_Chr14g0665811 [Helianthus annuus]KAJ0470793.1 hypothetical protein HanIR_Chr14g0722591 [Helianthus annuus]KAJ0842197.1 hypothetical protein HanPSC8_Chr14g0638921 [Helianthus annuus]KAJ0855792.1 hypothetical protein HanRHA438_Chr14g0677191 [Helianthus annuus]
MMEVNSDDERVVHGCRWWLWWTSEVGSTGKTMEKNCRWRSTPFKHPATIDTAMSDDGGQVRCMWRDGCRILWVSRIWGCMVVV